MKEYNHRKICPICDHTSFVEVMRGKDFTVSHDYFTIVECSNCRMQFTNPIPYVYDIGRYYKSESYISHSSTNSGLINKIYQRVRKYTLKRKLWLVQGLTKGKNVLDIGAGTGHFLNELSYAGFHAIGLEPDDDARKFAEDTFDVNIHPLDRLYREEKNSYDVITMWHVLEHVYNLKKDVTQIVDILKPNGSLVIAVPNRNSHDAKYYKEFWAAYDLPIHLYHFTPQDISNLFDQFGMEVKEIHPMKFDSFYVSMLSEKYKGGNFVKAMYRGVISNLKAKRNTYSSQIYILKKK